ncbi:MAG: AAA family ATPase [Acidobacteria bacterium]|nr:AAA family ATPase [Acidobacteriota bacterium]
MKLRTIRLENIRRFIDPVEITGIGDGLNVLVAPNEHGKSTVFDALHAVFFKQRNSWDKEVRSLKPHAGGDPTVAVEIELAGGIYWIRKRWNSRNNGDVRIETTGRLFKQADEAEDWIAEILKAPREGGPAGLLWVRQGITDLANDDAAQLARRDLLTSVAGEVEAMTGGRRMDAAMDRCRSELERYLTVKGRPKAGGPLKDWQDEVADLDTESKTLVAKSEKLRSELDRRRALRRELADLENPNEEEGRKTRLAKAKADHDKASRHAESLGRATEHEHTKRIEAERAKDRLTALDRAITEISEADREDRTAKKEEQRAIKRLSLAEAAMSESANVHRSALDRVKVVGDLLRRARLAESAAEAARHRQDLVGKINRAEALQNRANEASALARRGLPEPELAKLDKLDESVRVLRRARNLKAVAIAMTYAPGRLDSVSLDGRPLPEGKRMPIPDGARLDIEAVGRLDIHPGQIPDGETPAEAEANLARALEDSGVSDIAEARVSTQRRREAELDRRNAKADLESLAPDGIDELRDQLAQLPEQIADEDDLPTTKDAEQEDEKAREARDRAFEGYEAARNEHSEAQAAVARAGQAAESASTRKARAALPFSGIDDPEAERTLRRKALSRLRTELAKASRRREEAAATAPDLEAMAVALERAHSIVEEAEKRKQDIRLDLRTLDTSIGIQAGQAIDEDLADIDVRLEAARASLATIEFEVAALKELRAALETARTSARDRYVEPVMQELVPLLRFFWPEAELIVDPETLMPKALVRAGTEEAFDILSKGTQEQIALLVRLSFARMLAKTGETAPVILDDAIVYTDDDRIEHMFDALTRQARDLQIVVFSCRQKAFRDLGGCNLHIS